MAFVVSFDRLVDYDQSRPGITITIELKLGRSSISVPVKIDTGSTHCLFTRSVGEQLNIDIEAGERLTVSTVTGSFLSFGHWVTLVSEGFEFDSMIFFAADDSVGRNVLGRFGWLDRIIVGINDYDGILYLRSHDE